jgi:hypothetical protein
MEKQEIRRKAVEETAIAINSGILSPEAAAKSLVRRGIYEEKDVEGLEEFWKKMADSKSANPQKQPVGDRGGNTIGEDAGRVASGEQEQNSGARLRK